MRGSTAGWSAATLAAGAVLLAGCTVMPELSGAAGASRFAALQTMCGAQIDYGADAQSVYATLFDAYVAYRHGKLAQSDYCAFEAGIAEHYRLRAGGGADAQRAWVQYFNAQRVRAIDWRAQVDPTLRGG
ncbi:hypothetical protein [Trinickia sp. Y13]|uniref:hypothetical protein n=1 Tax=Trinickia sp. Y13 TaxID=2917807 RepID=UPI0024060615|nr:hypothetical protein [Trinickia sp. Y13]MDG0023395.1 hypothetical protein [Trinickia sp. Y13]